MNVYNGKPDWRTQETYDAYLEERANPKHGEMCPLCVSTSLEEFTHWRIIDNKFPYDRVSELHHMILPKRHTGLHDLTQEEKNELEKLITTALNGKYNFISLALPKNQSVPDHLHYHLIVPKSFD